MPSREELSNAFAPNAPAEPEMLVGSRATVLRLLNEAERVHHGSARVAFLAGGRGMGKTSLARFVGEYLEIHSGWVTISVSQAGVKDVDEAVRRILDSTLQKSLTSRHLAPVAENLQRHVEPSFPLDLKAKLRLSSDELSIISERFDDILAHLASLGGDRNGVCLILDDIDDLVSGPAFGDWLKRLWDSAAVSSSAMRVGFFLLLTGVPTSARRLVSGNPSLGRIISVHQIEPWSESESADFFRERLAQSGLRAAPRALKLMVDATGGAPLLAQMIGYQIVRIAEAQDVDESDVIEAIEATWTLLVLQYLGPDLREKLTDWDTRAFRRWVLYSQDEYLDVQKLIKQMRPDEANALIAQLADLESAGVLRPDRKAGSGLYAFSSPLHRAAIRLWDIVSASRKPR